MTREEKLALAGKLVADATKLVETTLGDDEGWPALVNLAGAASDIARARGGVVQELAKEVA